MVDYSFFQIPPSIQKILANHKNSSIIKIENQILLPGNDARTKFLNFARALLILGYLTSIVNKFLCEAVMLWIIKI